MANRFIGGVLSSRPQANTPFSSRASTGTYFDSAGVMRTAPINQPRLNYSLVGGTWTQPTVLIEPASTNILLYSQDFDNAAWPKIATVTANTTTAPDGTTTAWQLNNSGGQTDPMRGIFQAASGTTSTGPWIASVWLRAGTLSSARVSLSGASDDNIVANTLVTLTSSWQRVVISGFTGLPYSASSGVRFKLSTNAATGNYLVWGPQVELANPTSIRSVASPYTPTSTSTVIASNNNIYVTNTVASANLVVSNIVGFANSNNIVSVYQSYNASTNSLDVVFG